MASALENHLPIRREVNADVRPVDFLLENQRRIGKNAPRVILVEMLVVVRPLGAKEMRSSRIFDEIAVGTTHWSRPLFAQPRIRPSASANQQLPPRDRP